MGLFDLFKGKKKRKVYGGGVVIEYETTPPNFRDKDAPDEFGLTNTCGACKFVENITSTRPDCKKYGVCYEGIGCLDKTVCDDFVRKITFADFM